eukprot:scaffold2493_cov62-Phaeocystis_antarctica.AAC.1
MTMRDIREATVPGGCPPKPASPALLPADTDADNPEQARPRAETLHQTKRAALMMPASQRCSS